MSDNAPNVVASTKTLARKRLLGVPVLYLLGGAVAILGVYAWKTKSTVKTDTGTSDAASTDAASSGGELFPEMSTGTVTVAPATFPADTTPVGFESNDAWLTQGVAQLGAQGVSPVTAQVALQTYLSGAQLSTVQGAQVDKVIKEYGLPPYVQDAGGTVTPATPTNTPTPAPENPTALQLSITRWYQTYLKRTPATPEVDYWVNSNKTSSAIQAGIQNSSEAKEKQIGQYYVTYLGRTAFPTEIAFWRKTGKTPAQIQSSIQNSAEAKRRG